MWSKLHTDGAERAVTALPGITLPTTTTTPYPTSISPFHGSRILRLSFPPTLNGGLFLVRFLSKVLLTTTESGTIRYQSCG